MYIKEYFLDFYVFIVRICFSCSVSGFEKCIENHDLGSLFSSALKEKILLK